MLLDGIQKLKPVPRRVLRRVRYILRDLGRCSNQAIWGNVKSRRVRLPQVSIVKTAGHAKTKLTRPNPLRGSQHNPRYLESVFVPRREKGRGNGRSSVLENSGRIESWSELARSVEGGDGEGLPMILMPHICWAIITVNDARVARRTRGMVKSSMKRLK